MGLQPTQIILYFLSLALQQKFAKEINFRIKFLLKLLAIASFDEPIKRFTFVMPKKQLLYHMLKKAISADTIVCKIALRLASLIDISPRLQTLNIARHFSF